MAHHVLVYLRGNRIGSMPLSTFLAECRKMGITTGSEFAAMTAFNELPQNVRAKRQVMIDLGKMSEDDGVETGTNPRGRTRASKSKKKSKTNPSSYAKPPLSDDVLADAGLTRAVLATVKREIVGTDHEALAHWNVISDRLRQSYRDATKKA